MKKIISLFIIFLIFSCKGKNQNEINIDSHRSQIIDTSSQMKKQTLFRIEDDLIDTRISLNLDCLYEENCKSTLLDTLFKEKDATYFIADYAGGTDCTDYYFHILSLFKSSKLKKVYLLLFDKDNFLRDTLSLSDKEVSLEVSFENNEKGIALGYIDDTNLHNVYFEITNFYKITNRIKFQSLKLDTKIKKCSLPLKFLSEEYVGIEDYFKYGVKK